MTTSDAAVLPLLQVLVRICSDSAAGYASAIADTKDERLVHLFNAYENERAKMAAQIRQRISELRGVSNPAPTTAGAFHRAWMDLRSGAAANPEAALLSEIERGEALAVEAYRNALRQHDVDATTRRLLEHGYELVQSAHDRIKQLRDRAAAEF